MTKHLDLSLGEFEALCRKACVGAGYSWGQAEDAGKAMRWLCANGVAATGALTALLAQRKTGELGAFRCPIEAGTMLCDGLYQPEAGPVDLGSILSPVLMFPFAGWAAQSKQISLAVEVAGTDWHIAKTGVLTAPPSGAVPAVAQVLVTADSPPNSCKIAAFSRASITPETFEILSQFAQKTYAPATEASRVQGAGAGLSDND